MAKLDPIEKQAIVSALIAMSAECPPEAQEENAAICRSIAFKLDLREAIDRVRDSMKSYADAANGGGEERKP